MKRKVDSETPAMDQDRSSSSKKRRRDVEGWGVDEDLRREKKTKKEKKARGEEDTIDTATTPNAVTQNGDTKVKREKKQSKKKLKEEDSKFQSAGSAPASAPVDVTEVGEEEPKGRKQGKTKKQKTEKSAGDISAREEVKQEAENDKIEEKKKDKKNKKDKKSKSKHTEGGVIPGPTPEPAATKTDKRSKKDKKKKKSASSATEPSVMENEGNEVSGSANGGVQQQEAEGLADEEGGNGAVAASRKTRFVVFVGNLPFTATAESVRAHFVSLRPADVRLLTDRNNPSRSRGIAFVEFADYSTMKTCLAKFHHSSFEDGISPARSINVELTAGGGGKTKNRTEKITAKNEKLSEERARRLKAEKEAKAKAKAEEDERDGIHPSRRAQMTRKD